MGSTVAVRILRADAVSNLERKRRFLREARPTSALNHSRYAENAPAARRAQPSPPGVGSLRARDGVKKRKRPAVE